MSWHEYWETGHLGLTRVIPNRVEHHTPCKDCGTCCDSYMVRHEVWNLAHGDNESTRGHICYECIDLRLHNVRGHGLRFADFMPDPPINRQLFLGRLLALREAGDE